MRPLSGLLLASLLVFAQEVRPSFTVASVKPSAAPDNPKHPDPGKITYDPVRFTALNMPLKFLILDAYGLQQNRVSGGPEWLDSENYDILAAAEKPSTKAEMKVMLQSLLEQRFHLTVRQESRPTNVYVLTVPKGGPKFGPDFHEVKPDDPRPDYPFAPGGPIHPRMTMTQLVSFLTQSQDPDPAAGHPVIDETGLTGTYDLTLTGKVGEWFPAVEHQLGLKVETRKSAVDYLVITHVERPSAN
jgi:uncharacterized protein (TIGR03435 family)